ncbi:class I SAM-dependent methyltransferase [Nocardia sp. NPDC058499]|uniref:class I SAM-dependent methyltransferase n=1 Tax=Nocardia sp. NPDC058499 TaxID=3346530 RepID=UPI00364E8D40
MSDSTDQYDQIAASFDEVEAVIHFVRENLDWPSFRRALGVLEDCRVLDVGCGEGGFTRRIKELGAKQVVGTDLSAGMVALAEQAEARDPRGIVYHVYDLGTMQILGDFDIVTAIHVLHYADSRSTMAAMANVMYANLAPGGRLVALSANAESSAESQEAAGFRNYRPESAREGDKFKVAVMTDPPTEIEVHHWPTETIVNVLGEAGFVDVQWEPVTIKESVAPADLDRALRCAADPTSLIMTATKR